MPRWKPWLPVRSYEDLVGRVFTRRDLQAISRATRREIMDWIEAGIITAEARPGAGVHRDYTWLNVLEASAATSMSPTLRAGTIADIFRSVRSILDEAGLKLDDAERRRGEFVFLISMVAEDEAETFAVSKHDPEDKRIRVSRMRPE